jgi:hypothetical protein
LAVAVLQEAGDPLSAKMNGAYFLLVIHIFALTAFAQASEPSEPSDSTREFWPEIDLFVKLNEKARIFALISATRPENLKSFADGQNGVHLDFYGVPPLRKYPLVNAVDPSRSKSLMVRVGYLISRPKTGSSTSVEHMATSEATIRAHLRRELLLSVRNRADFRWVDGDPKHRYRNRIKLEKTLAVGRFQLTPYAHAEVFYDFNVREWTRLRYAGGAEWTITKRIVFEAYFLRQNTWGTVPQFVDATGLALQLYFR